MKRTAVERDVSMCFACGREAGSEPVCPFCFTTTALAPAETVTDSSISVGYEGGGRRAVVAIGVSDEQSAMIFTVAGVARRVTVRHLRQYTPITGLRTMTSRAAAALVALEHLPVPTLTDITVARRSVITTLVMGRVEVARRVGADLAAAGCVGPIEDLPLTE